MIHILLLLCSLTGGQRMPSVGGSAPPDRITVHPASRDLHLGLWSTPPGDSSEEQKSGFGR